MALKNKKTECAPLEWSQFLMLIDSLKKSNDYTFLLLVCVGGYCGLRLSDILQLRWSDVLNKEQFELIEKKTGKHRIIGINPNLKEVISHCYNHNQGINKSQEYIFLNRQGKILTRQYLNRKLHLVFEKYQIKVRNGSSHTLRKTFAKRVYQINNCSEAALILLSSIFNHNSISVTRKYIGLQQAQISDVYASI